MSDLLEALTSQVGGNELEQLTRLTGADREHAQKAVPAAMATLLGGLAGNAARDEGASALHTALRQDHDGSALDGVAGFLGRDPTGTGEKILGHVLGGRRPAVESRLSESTGLDARTIGKLLASLAPIVLAQLGRAQREQDLDAGGLADLLGRERRQIQRRPPSNLGGLAALLDQDGDGEIADDLTETGAGLLGRLFGRR